jgi:selenocysteine lyase/cysteine desulfurase
MPAVDSTGMTTGVTTPSIDVEAERSATPGCTTVTHLNNAGASLPTTDTLETVIAHLRLEAERGGYEAAALATDRLAGVRSSAARLIGARPSEVAITGSDTHAWAKALWGFAIGGGIGPGQRLLADRIAYDSHYLGLLQVSQLTGATIEVVPSTADGTIDLDALEASLTGRNGETGEGVALVSITHIGTHRGLINPVEEAGARCRRAGVPLFLDACQSLGQTPVDVGRIGCAVLTGTGRKWLRGPRGTGILCVRDDIAERMVPPGIDGKSAVWDDAGGYTLQPGAGRFVDFEVPVAGHLGLGVAIDHTLELGVEAIAARVDHLAERLRSALAGIDGVGVHDGGSRRSGIVTFTVERVPPDQVVAAASSAGINLTYSDAISARLDLAAPRPLRVVRASPHYYNTEDELDRLVGLVEELSTRTGPA